MPLIEDGRLVDDRFERIEDGEAVSEALPVLVPAARFLADAAEFTNREGPTGVVWPNDRRVSELAPYLDRLNLIVLSFPKFRDGRAYSQARQLREHHGYAGRLRATGEVLRDQLLFMLRAGFDSFDVKKPEDAAAFDEARARYSVFYQPAGGNRLAAPQAWLAKSAERRPWTVRRHSAEEIAALDKALAHATPEEILKEAIRSMPSGKLAVVSAFGIESAALLKLVADIDASLPVIFIDTGWHFGETLGYVETLIAHFGLKDVRTVKPRPEDVGAKDPDVTLWWSDPDACCALRKVAPLAEALAPFSAWITGRKRYQGADRATLPIVEVDGTRLKFNPFARLSPKDVTSIFRSAGLPRHPLAARGFTSIGCLPCSSLARANEGPRDGRWRGRGKTECGIHASGVTAA